MAVLKFITNKYACEQTCRRINNSEFSAIHPGRLLDPVYRINPVTDIKNIVRHVEIKYHRRIRRIRAISRGNKKSSFRDGMF